MPAGEPNPDAPENVWAGEYDGQQFADALGMSWIAPLFSSRITRVVNIPTLCASSPPSAPVFTATDIVTGLIPGAGRDAADAKVVAWTDAYLWRTYCTAVDDPTPDPIPPQDPPADWPVNVPPIGSDRMLRDIHLWTDWSVRQFIPRSYHIGSEQFVSGTGSITFVQDFTGDWPVWPAGVIVTVQAKPDYVGRSNGGDFPVYYDLGWFSLANGTNAQSPIRLQHEMQMVYGSLARVSLVYYNLAPDVDVSIAPLFPDTAEHIAE